MRTWKRQQPQASMCTVCLETPCQLPTGTRAPWSLTCIWKEKGHPLTRSLGIRLFLPPGQVTFQVYDPSWGLLFLMVSSFSYNLVSLALFYKTGRLSNAKLTRLAELVSPLLGQFSNYSPVVIKFL
jgi:hypothetical protein